MQTGQPSRQYQWFTVSWHTSGGISPCKATNCADIQFYWGCFGFAIMLIYVNETHQCSEELKAAIKMETFVVKCAKKKFNWVDPKSETAQWHRKERWWYCLFYHSDALAQHAAASGDLAVSFSRSLRQAGRAFKRHRHWKILRNLDQTWNLEEMNKGS